MKTLFPNGKTATKPSRLARQQPEDTKMRFVSNICDRFGWEYPVAIPGGSELLFTYGEITPEIGQILLDEYNIENNRSRTKVLAGIADLKRGGWKMTHQGIAFNRSGRMCDGQHRCQIAVEAGLPLPTHIAFNVEDDGVKAVDINKVRTTLDMSRMFNLGLDKQAIASIRWILASGRHLDLSPEQVELLCDIFREGIACAKSAITSHVKHVTMSPMYGALARASYHESHDRLREFGRVVVTGDPAGIPNYTAALRLRNTLRDTLHHGGPLLVRAFELTETAISKFCRGEKVQVLRIPNDYKSPYDLPKSLADQVAIVLGE